MKLHGGTIPGKRVILTLRNGAKYCGKFIEHHARRRVRLEEVVVKMSAIRSMTIYRGQDTDEIGCLPAREFAENEGVKLL